jgi:hypothetical protein
LRRDQGNAEPWRQSHAVSHSFQSSIDLTDAAAMGRPFSLRKPCGRQLG